MLSSKAPDAILKIADFGFASVCRGEHDLEETLGTPPYMGNDTVTSLLISLAPEIVCLRNEDEDNPGYGKSVDIWALGVCLYILYVLMSWFTIPKICFS